MSQVQLSQKFSIFSSINRSTFWQQFHRNSKNSLKPLNILERCKASSLIWQFPPQASQPIRSPPSPQRLLGIDGRAVCYAGDRALGLSGLGLSCSRFVVPLADTWGTIKLKIIGSRSPPAIDPLCQWTLWHTVDRHTHSREPTHGYCSYQHSQIITHANVYLKIVHINYV